MCASLGVAGIGIDAAFADTYSSSIVATGANAVTNGTIGAGELAVVNFAPVWGDKETNKNHMLEFMKQAADAGVKMVVFPEMALTGYVSSSDPDSEAYREEEEGDILHDILADDLYLADYPEPLFLEIRDTALKWLIDEYGFIAAELSPYPQYDCIVQHIPHFWCYIRITVRSKPMHPWLIFEYLCEQEELDRNTFCLNVYKTDDGWEHRLVPIAPHQKEDAPF